MRAVLAALLFVVACCVSATSARAAGVNVFIGSATIPTVAEENIANLWVDDDATGTCARQATMLTYVDGTSCESFVQAYEEAICGDMIRIKGALPYPSQAIFSTQKNCSSQYVTFAPAIGETVTIGGASVGTGGVAICDADWIKFLGSRTGATSTFNVVDDGTQGEKGDFVMGSGSCQFGLSERVDHVWIEGTSFESFLIRGADQVTFVDNDIAAGKSNDFDETNFVTNGYDGAFRDNYSTDVVFDRNDIHNFTSDECAGVNDCHIECLTGEFENLVMRRNKIWECGNTAAVIFSQDAGFSTKGTGNLLENNLIHDAENIPLQLGDAESGSVITMRFNTIRRVSGASTTSALGGTLAGTVHMIGNVLETGNGFSCAVINGTWAYNVIAGGGSGCNTGGTGNLFSTTTTFVASVPDYHLAASQAAQDLVPPGSCAALVDLDGNPRPNGTNCDAGADER